MIEKITTKYPDFDDLKYTVNQLVDAVNELQTRSENVQDVDICELTYLQKENCDLKDELKKLQKMFFIAKKGLVFMQENVLEYAADYMDYADDVLQEIKELDNE